MSHTRSTRVTPSKGTFGKLSRLLSRFRTRGSPTLSPHGRGNFTRNSTIAAAHLSPGAATTLDYPGSPATGATNTSVNGGVSGPGDDGASFAYTEDHHSLMTTTSPPLLSLQDYSPSTRPHSVSSVEGASPDASIRPISSSSMAEQSSFTSGTTDNKSQRTFKSQVSASTKPTTLLSSHSDAGGGANRIAVANGNTEYYRARRAAAVAAAVVDSPTTSPSSQSKFDFSHHPHHQQHRNSNSQQPNQNGSISSSQHQQHQQTPSPNQAHHPQHQQVQQQHSSSHHHERTNSFEKGQSSSISFSTLPVSSSTSSFATTPPLLGSNLRFSNPNPSHNPDPQSPPCDNASTLTLASSTFGLSQHPRLGSIGRTASIGSGTVGSGSVARIYLDDEDASVRAIPPSRRDSEASMAGWNRAASIISTTTSGGVFQDAAMSPSSLRIGSVYGDNDDASSLNTAPPLNFASEDGVHSIDAAAAANSAATTPSQAIASLSAPSSPIPGETHEAIFETATTSEETTHDDKPEITVNGTGSVNADTKHT